MVGAGAEMLQAEAEIGGRRKVYGLQWRQALVVVDRCHGVEFTLQVPMEDRIAGQGAGDVMAFRAQGIEGGPDQRIIFLAE